MSNYTPSTAQVKATWCADERYGGPSRAELSAEFDRWLEAHDREVAAKALRTEAFSGLYGTFAQSRLLDRAARIETGEDA